MNNRRIINLENVKKQKFSLGQTVLIRESGQLGTVCRCEDRSLYWLDIGGSMECFFEEELDEDLSSYKPQGSDRQPARVDEVADPSALYVAFVPEKGAADSSGFMDVYLINESASSLEVSYVFTVRSGTVHQQKQVLSRQATQYLHRLHWDQLNDGAMIILRWERDHAVGPAEITQKLKPNRFFSKMGMVPLLQCEGYVYRFPLSRSGLSQLPVAHVVSEQKVLTAMGRKPTMKEKEIAVPEVCDLHIQALEPNWHLMSSAEILTKQLKVFQRFLDQSVACGHRRIVVIHGVGNGTLRSKVHELLKTDPRVADFEYGYLPPYGFGATVVNLH